MHDFIAEIGTSHLGSLEKAKRMIDAARSAGATTAKFQWVIADEIVSRRAGSISLPSGSTDIYKYFASVERDSQFYRELKAYTETCGLQFLCSVFGVQSLKMLLGLNPQRIKIASPEINHVELLYELAQHKIGVILSSGVASLIDILRAVDILCAGKVNDISILRCVTEYPASPYSYSLRLLTKYASLFHCRCGISDHTQHPTMLPCVAAMLGSTIVEKHLTLPRKHVDDVVSPDDPIALLPEQFSHMVRETTEIAATYQAGGSAHAELIKRYGEKEIQAIMNTADTERESKGTIVRRNSAVLLPHYFTTRRSLFARKDIPAREALSRQNCTLLRSEHNSPPGIPTEAYTTIMNKPIRKTISEGSPIRLEHFL